jgi:hypothetical protein
VSEDSTLTTGAKQATGLNPLEVQALFRLVIKRPAPALTSEISEPEAVLFLASGILKGHSFDPAVVLTILARMWAWLEDDTDRGMVLNVVDRRYVGWNRLGRSVLIDTVTGDEITPATAMPRILESIAYNLYELLERRAAISRGERTTLWESKDATGHTPRSEAAENSGGLGEPQGVRDNAGAAVP